MKKHNSKCKTYANIPTKWPTDPRLVALRGNDARWLYACLWLKAVANRSSVLPRQCTPKELSRFSQVPLDRIQSCLRGLALNDLIGTLAPELGEHLVIPGVREKHRDIREWEEEEPDEILNPWREKPEYEWWPAQSEYARMNGEKRKNANDSPPDPLDDCPLLNTEFDNLRILIEQAHPDCRIQFSRPGTKQYRQERRTLERLVRLDQFDEQTVVDVLTWVLTDDHEDAQFWRKNFRSFSNLRKRCRNDATKFQAMHAVWRAAGNLTPKEIDEFLRREGLA